jgi:hypothetical protein
MPDLWSSGLSLSLSLVIPDIFYRESILVSVQMDPRHQHAGMTEGDGSPPQTAGMTEGSGHAQRLLSGIHLGFISDGSLPPTCRDDEKKIEPRRGLAGTAEGSGHIRQLVLGIHPLRA